MKVGVAGLRKGSLFPLVPPAWTGTPKNHRGGRPSGRFHHDPSSAWRPLKRRPPPPRLSPGGPWGATGRNAGRSNSGPDPGRGNDGARICASHTAHPSRAGRRLSRPGFMPGGPDWPASLAVIGSPRLRTNGQCPDDLIDDPRDCQAGGRLSLPARPAPPGGRSRRRNPAGGFRAPARPRRTSSSTAWSRWRSSATSS